MDRIEQVVVALVAFVARVDRTGSAGGSLSSNAKFGRIRSSQPGNHQVDRPRSVKTAGTTAMRITIASTKIPPARPRPNSLMTISPPRMKEPKTRIMMSAAALIVLPVAARPFRTASLLSPVLTHSSWILVTKKTW